MIQIEDWYSVTLAELREVGFPSTVTKKDLVELLSQKYPEYKWDWAYILRGKYGQQKRLERAVTELFPVRFSYLLWFVYRSLIIWIKKGSSFMFYLFFLFSLQKDAELKINARKEAGLLNTATGAYLELDIYLPSFKIAFEYQVNSIKNVLLYIFLNFCVFSLGYSPLQECQLRLHAFRDI